MPHTHLSALSAPILAGLLPSRGALVGIAALVALAILDRIPLRAYRPRDDHDRMPPPRRRRAPTVTLTRRDQQPAPPARRAIQPRRPQPHPPQPRKEP